MKKVCLLNFDGFRNETFQHLNVMGAGERVCCGQTLPWGEMMLSIEMRHAGSPASACHLNWPRSPPVTWTSSFITALMRTWTWSLESGHDSFLVFFLFGESVFFLVELELELRAASSRWFRLVAVLVFNPSPIYFQCLSTCFSSNQNFSLSCQQLVSVLSRDWFCPIRVSLVWLLHRLSFVSILWALFGDHCPIEDFLSLVDLSFVYLLF